MGPKGVLVCLGFFKLCILVVTNNLLTWRFLDIHFCFDDFCITKNATTSDNRERNNDMKSRGRGTPAKIFRRMVQRIFRIHYKILAVYMLVFNF